MKQGIATKLAGAACAMALGLSLFGCAPTAPSSATEAQQANRAYMSRVNETMVELDDGLDGFVDAVSRGDIVNMRTQADNAYKTLDKLSQIEAPEEMKAIHENYVSGTAKLREALDAYITLYSDTAKSGASLDATSYNASIGKIQSLYDEGVALLQKGDEAAGATQATASDQPESNVVPRSSFESA